MHTTLTYDGLSPDQRQAAIFHKLATGCTEAEAVRVAAGYDGDTVRHAVARMKGRGTRYDLDLPTAVGYGAGDPQDNPPAADWRNDPAAVAWVHSLAVKLYTDSGCSMPWDEAMTKAAAQLAADRTPRPTMPLPIPVAEPWLVPAR